MLLARASMLSIREMAVLSVVFPATCNSNLETVLEQCHPVMARSRMYIENVFFKCG